MSSVLSSSRLVTEARRSGDARVETGVAAAAAAAAREFRDFRVVIGMVNGVDGRLAVELLREGWPIAARAGEVVCRRVARPLRPDWSRKLAVGLAGACGSRYIADSGERGGEGQGGEAIAGGNGCILIAPSLTGRAKPLVRRASSAQSCCSRQQNRAPNIHAQGFTNKD